MSDIIPLVIRRTNRETTLERMEDLVKNNIIPSSRVCTKCNLEKNYTDFYLRYRPLTDTTDLGAHCRQCTVAKIKSTPKKIISEEERIKKNKVLRSWYETTKTSNRIKALLRLYGINLKEYNLLIEKYNNSCGICGIHQSELEKSLCVDHCHKTGKIRGLLCNCCNMVLGKFEDDLQMFQKAIDYLKQNT